METYEDASVETEYFGAHLRILSIYPAAAAKSLQSYLTLRDPIDTSVMS